MSIEKAIGSAKASLAISGLFLTPAEEMLIKESLEGKITEEEFHQRVLGLLDSTDN
ncbi:hypothetical protein ACFRCQ_22465 [Cytobacillus firmus]|uniref:hypothetical protein n=1 Tax=Cytobacillus firmus TaxID=1399 RepID=UPI0036B657E7